MSIRCAKTERRRKGWNYIMRQSANIQFSKAHCNFAGFGTLGETKPYTRLSGGFSISIMLQVRHTIELARIVVCSLSNVVISVGARYV